MFLDFITHYLKRPRIKRKDIATIISTTRKVAQSTIERDIVRGTPLKQKEPRKTQIIWTITQLIIWAT